MTADLPLIVDIEASALENGYPIEVGIADLGQGTVHAWLIRPHAAWAWDAWNPASAKIHGLTKADLDRDERVQPERASRLTVAGRPVHLFRKRCTGVTAAPKTLRLRSRRHHAHQSRANVEFGRDELVQRERAGRRRVQRRSAHLVDDRRRRPLGQHPSAIQTNQARHARLEGFGGARLEFFHLGQPMRALLGVGQGGKLEQMRQYLPKVGFDLANIAFSQILDLLGDMGNVDPVANGRRRQRAQGRRLILRPGEEILVVGGAAEWRHVSTLAASRNGREIGLAV